MTSTKLNLYYDNIMIKNNFKIKFHFNFMLITLNVNPILQSFNLTFHFHFVIIYTEQKRKEIS